MRHKSKPVEYEPEVELPGSMDKERVFTHSAYDTFVGRVDRRGRRDPLFHTRIGDFDKALIRARSILKEYAGE